MLQLEIDLEKIIDIGNATSGNLFAACRCSIVLTCFQIIFSCNATHYMIDQKHHECLMHAFIV